MLCPTTLLTCVGLQIDDFPTPHTEYIMAMAMHGGHLITGGADKLIALTDVAWARASRMARIKHDASTLSSDDSRHSDLPVGGPRGLSGLGAFDDDMTAIILRRGNAGSAAVDDNALSGVDSGHPQRTLRGHRGQILCLHPHGEQLASCATDGEVLIWSLRDGAILRRHHSSGSIYSLALGEVTLATGGEGAVRVCDWRNGKLVWAAEEEGGNTQPPKGVTTCLHRQGPLLCAGNSDTHSQLRIWDLRSNPHAQASMRDCFSFPAYVKGVRCICGTR